MNSSLVWINVCEASADNYGALLMQELTRRIPGVEFMGMGGPAMRAMGIEAVVRSEDISLVGLTEVFTSLPRILGYLKKIRDIMRKRKPAVLVLLDAPDFNFRLARMARSLGIPVLYYIAPQVWAWRRSRVRFLRNHVDRVACIFPFEQAFLGRYQVRADFVGHPLMESLDFPRLDAISPNKNQVAILPGSRKKEISSLLPVFSRVADGLRKSRPDLIFNVVRAPGVSLEFLHQFCPPKPWYRFIPPENRHEAMKKSRLAFAASGTVTLECAVLEVPAIVAYKLSPLSYLAGRVLIRVRHISMPNLILGREVFPELIQKRANVENVLACARVWLDDSGREEQVKQDLKKVRSLLGTRRASRVCAGYVLELMNRGKTYGKT